MSEEDKPEVVLISVAARIPEFWTDQPALWFIHFEAAVAPQKANDNAKYQLLIAKLSKQVIQQVAAFLETPPEDKKYDALKKHLLDIYEESETKRIQKLMGEMQLGDQKPSQLLRRMKSLAGTRVSSQTLLVLWQNHLPTALRTVLAATTLEDADKLAEVADKVMETTRPIEVAAVTQEQQSNHLSEAIAKLTLEVAELRRGKFNTRSRSRSNQRYRGRGYGQRRDQSGSEEM
ncbi:uncharacterized protein LOC132902994 [Amyelois transitella]|uniref:uncharacterized protein LOC132902994 n=1 Tax=Amyelois transitella TaxID=680683 RepID=UPI00298F5569|nr:uncharacterized protein LOC132902994 [Amyelois transitella]